MSKDNFFKGIGSYWHQFFQDRSILEVFGTASTEMLSSVYMELSNLVLSLSHEDVPVYDRFKWDALILKASDVGIVDGKYRFPLPVEFNTKGLRRSPVILSSVVSPKVIFSQGYDFAIGDAFIEFGIDPFGISDIPIREVGGDVRITLWCPTADIDTNRIWRNYGHFIKRWRFSTPAYKNFVRGMFHTRMFGPIINRIESGLQLLAGIPVADGRDNETVIAITDKGGSSVVRTTMGDYIIPSPDAGIRVNIGDVLSPFQVMTDIITVVDYLSEPDWWVGRIGELPSDIGVTVDVNKAFDQYLKYNTFLVKVNYATFLDAISRDGGSVLFETKKVRTYRKIGGSESFKLDGSYRLGAVVSEDLLGYIGSSNMAGFLREFKPAYTYAIILFFLAFGIPIPFEWIYSLLLGKDIDWQYPWDVNRLDGSWKIGVDYKLLKLGGFALDGSHVLSEITEGFAHRQLYYRILTSSRLLRKFLKNEEYIYAQLGESKLKVGCSGWKVGVNRILTLSDAYFRKQTPIDTPPVYGTVLHSSYPLWYPRSPAQIIGVHKLSGLKRLDGSWGIGSPLLPLRLGDFKVVREKSILQDFGKKIKKEAGFGILKRLTGFNRLGIYKTRRLDGGWRVGAYNKVDGSWKLRLGKRLAAPRFAYASLKLDGEWRVGGTTRDIRLDGGWQLSGGQGAYMDITISSIVA